MDVLNAAAVPALETRNFRVDSTGWQAWRSPNGILVLHDPARQITEFVEGPFAGEQLFTLKAALDETEKAGKRMPDRSEWGRIIANQCPNSVLEKGWFDDVSVRDAFDLALAGYRDQSSGAHYYANTFGFYWVFAPTKGNEYLGHCVSVSSNQTRCVTKCHREVGYSVRCLEN